MMVKMVETIVVVAAAAAAVEGGLGVARTARVVT